MKRSIIAAIIGLACLPLLDVAALAAGQAKPVMVFAAASLKNALDEIEIAWMRETGKKATIVYAASNMLAKQIEAGARLTCSSPRISTGWNMRHRRRQSTRESRQPAWQFAGVDRAE